ncbi:MAG: zeta toxin family protein [Saprospiraceae bacterium]|nr:zeta toxin family protein [Saprospiraceae bacterium]
MSGNPMNRMRVFAGPNGSGKSAVYNLVRQQYRIGYYVNADNIEKELREKGFIQLSDLGIQISPDQFQAYLSKTPYLQKSHESALNIQLTLSDNVLVCSKNESNSYEAAFVAEMVRWEYLKNRFTFSFETVMSHPSKIDFFNAANELGYRCYLYFVCTQHPAINIARIKNRVMKGGHEVPENKVMERYFRSLETLANTAKAAYRTFILTTPVMKPY